MKEFKGEDVTLTINGEPITQFVDVTVEIKPKCKLLKKGKTELMVIDSFVWHLWATSFETNYFTHHLYLTWTKPTKQLELMKVAILGMGVSYLIIDEYVIRQVLETISVPKQPYIEREFIEATPHVAIYPPAILAQIVWAAALRHFYRR